MTAGFIDQVAVRKDLAAKNPDGIKHASSRGVPYSALDIDEDVFIHPSSALFHGPPPDYVVYHEVVRGTRVWMKSKFRARLARLYSVLNNRTAVTVINPAWLHVLAPAMCTFSKPKDLPSSMKRSALNGSVVNPVFGGKFMLPPVQL